MSEPFSLKYRPRSFADTVGQKPVRAILRQMIIKDDIPPAMLFTGPRGTGKTTTGRILAAALNCEAREKADPCGQCASCKAVWNGSSMDVIEQDAASSGLVADIRQIRETVMYSTGGEWRVVLLDEAHSMSKEAFNALLKTLEEPPPSTVFVLLTTEPGRILETVVSRCMRFEFVRVSPQDIADRLTFIAERESLDVTPELIQLIADRSNGGLRDAVMTLDQVRTVNCRTPEEFALLHGEIDAAPAIISAVLAGDVTSAFAALDQVMYRTGDAVQVATDLVSCLRDCLVLSGGGEIQRVGDQLQQRRQISAVGPAKLTALARVLWDFKTRVRASENMRTALELAIVIMVDAVTVTKSVTAESGPMSLEAMRAAASR